LTEKRLTYAQDDVLHLIRLYERLMELVEKRGLEEGKKLLERVYPFYMRAQYQGVPFDVDLFDAVRERLKVEVADAEADLARHRPAHPEDGETWVWGNSNKPDAVDKYGNRIGRNGALKALSLVGIELPDLKKSTRVEYLAIHKDEAPLLDALHKYKKFSDLLSDAESWVKFNYEDGRLYPDVKPFSQVTGRSAYANPPLQNIPRALPDELEGVIIESFRDCVRASRGSRIVKCDYAAQELRIIAAVSGDVNLIESFKSGKDPHLVVGEQIAGKPLTEGTEEHKTYRAFGKRANYGFSYGAGATTYIKSIFEDTSQRVGEDQAKREQEAFQTAWPKVHRWQRQEGARDGTEPGAWFTTSFVGRRRYVGVRYNREGYPVPAYTDRLNGPVQSGGADMLYVALAMLMDDQESGYMAEATVLFTTHDEITLEVPEEMASEAAEWLSKRMQEAAEWFIGPQLGGTDCVEAKVAPSWGGN